jgi:glycosyltransferase involved in cell wall biosynthesis
VIENSDVMLFMGTYPPRECGIAMFTRDLSDAVEKKFFPYLTTKIIAMNSNGVSMYNYPKKVLYQLSDNKKENYKKLALEINQNDKIKIVSIQHEFGIFGGDVGEYLIDFLKNLNKPKIITFHSILPEPDAKRLDVVCEIAKNVDQIVVMTPKGMEILKEKYHVKIPIKVIPHGIPTVAFENQKAAKKKLGLEDKLVVLSFGMMSVNKGYKYMIESLPAVIEKHPDLLYVIVGATHPNIRKHEGEKYRNSLINLVKKLGLENHVKFYNRYAPLSEIVQFLKACDVYVHSSFTPEQITSGTLAYAMGCGRAIVSTPFLHAQDMVNHERGVLTKKFRNPKAFSEALLEVLADKNRLKEMEQNSYEFTRSMTWPNVALAYGEIIKEHIAMPDVYFEKLPKINVAHLKRMTDNFGMMQFAKYATPKTSSGYTLDDNSRALVVAAKLHAKTNKKIFLDLAGTYLSCMKYVQDDDGKFLNLITKDKLVDKNSWSEEAHGRAMQALGTLIPTQALPAEMKKEAEELFHKALPVTSDIYAPRALAAIVEGLHNYNKEHYSEDWISTIQIFADRLVELYNENSSSDWSWFEKELTYANSKIPEALIYAYMTTRNQKYLDIALTSLNFLISKTFENGVFVPIGQNGWYKKDGERAYFDQQPIDAASMVHTLALAYKVTKNSEYGRMALAAFQWYLGKNTLKRVIYDEKTGGCYDGLDKEAANLNQGAESTLAYLSARLKMEELA